MKEERPMALDPIVWALRDALVADAIERPVLAIYAEHADEDGCNAYPSYKTVAERAMTDPRTVIRRVQDLVQRGLLSQATRRRPPRCRSVTGRRSTT
jgi:hypothetical protein